MSSNPKRGANYRNVAIEFAQKYPIGSIITWEEFCAWMFDIGLIDKPQPNTDDKQSDVWLAHLQRRHQGRMNLNKGASHSELVPHGGAYVVETMADQQLGSKLVVRSTLMSAISGRTASKIQSIANTKRRQLEVLIDSHDWDQLPPYEKVFAESLYEDVNMFAERTRHDAEHINGKFARLESRIRKLCEAGAIHVRNGGIAGFLEHDNED